MGVTTVSYSSPFTVNDTIRFSMDCSLLHDSRSMIHNLRFADSLIRAALAMALLVITRTIFLR